MKKVPVVIKEDGVNKKIGEASLSLHEGAFIVTGWVESSYEQRFVAELKMIRLGRID